MKKFFYSLILIFLFSIVNLAQTPSPTATPKTIGNDDDVVKISTNLIQIDVTVTDLKGNIINDLKPEEIEIYENGKKQEISNLSFISSVQKRVIATTAAKKSAEKVPEPIPPTVLKPEQVRRTIALVVDDLSLSFESVHFVRLALKKFVDEQMQDGDLVAIIRTGAGIGALQQFTSNKRQLYAAIEKIIWNAKGSGGFGAFAPIEGIPPTLDEKDKATFTDIQNTQKKIREYRESIFASGTLGAINYIVRGMQPLPGRKSIMLLSDGFSLVIKRDGFTDTTHLLEPLKRLIDAANRAAVVINTMDARGLQITGITAADDTSGRTVKEVEGEADLRSEKLENNQAGLAYLARQTGGSSIINNNDLSGEIRKMLDNQSYYLVGYQPDDETFDPVKRRFNSLEVKVKRKDVKVRFRSGFFGVTDEKIATAGTTTAKTESQQILTALTSPFAVNDISLRLNTLFGNVAKTGSYVQSFLHIDTKGLKFTNEPDGTHKATFDVLAISYGDNGTIADSLQKNYTLTVKDEIYKNILDEGFVYEFQFPVKKPGAYQMRVAIRDAASAKVGSANQFIEVPDLKQDRLTLSGIVLENLTAKQWSNMQVNLPVNTSSNTSETNPMMDTSLRRFKKGTILRYGVEVYNAKLDQAKKPQLQTQVKIFRDGKLVLNGKPNPFNLQEQQDLEKLNFVGALDLGNQLPSGEYILQIILIDNLAKEKNKYATQWIQFEITE